MVLVVSWLSFWFLVAVLVVPWLCSCSCCGCTPGHFCDPGCVVTVLLVLFVILVVSWLNPWYFLWSGSCRGLTTIPGCGLGCVVAVYLALLWLDSWSCLWSWSCHGCTLGPCVVAAFLVLLCLYF